MGKDLRRCWPDLILLIILVRRERFLRHEHGRETHQRTKKVLNQSQPVFHLGSLRVPSPNVHWIRYQVCATGPYVIVIEESGSKESLTQREATRGHHYSYRVTAAELRIKSLDGSVASWRFSFWLGTLVTKKNGSLRRRGIQIMIDSTRYPFGPV